jgi:hypothetical protein
MTSYTLSPVWGAGAQLFDNNGNMLTGGKIYTYDAGTTTPAVTYTDAIGNNFNSNPIVADASGRLANEIWFPVSGSYKFVLKDSNDVLIATYDNIPTIPQPPIVNDASSISYEQGYTVTAGAFTVGSTYLITSVGTTNFVAIGAGANVTGILFTATGVGSGTGTAQYSRTVQNKLRDTVSVKDFGAVGDGVTDDVAAIDAGIAYLISAGGGTLYFPAGEYAISTDTVNGIKIENAAGITLCGAGQLATTIKNLAANPGHTISIFNSNNICIEDLTVDGNRLNQVSSGHGIRGENVDKLTIQNVTVQQTYSYGIGLQDGDFKNVRIHNVNIEYTGADGIDCKNIDSGPGTGNENLFISNISVKQWGLRNDLNVQAAIDLRGAWELSNVFVREPGATDCHGIRFRFGEPGDLANGLGGHRSKLSNFYIDLGTTTTAGVGLSVNAPFITVTNGYIKGGADSIQVISGGTTVTKDVCISNVFIDTHADEGIIINGDDVLISNCVITGGNEGVRTVGARTKLIGCVMDGCDEGFVAQTGGDNLLLQGCSIINSVTRAGRIDAGVTGVQIIGGILKDNAAAISGATLADVIDNVTGSITFTPYKSFVLASSAVAVPLTGTTATTPLATIAIPANRMGLNGYFVVSTVWSCTNNANRKSYLLQFGTTVSDIDLANSASYSDQRTIQNRNSASSQVIFAGTGGFGTSTTALSTAAQNTTTSINLIINGDLANAGDTMTLESYRVELVYIP